MRRNPKGRLELTWMGKDSALIPVEDGKYDYGWVDPADPRAREVKSIEVLEQVGEVDGPTGASENLLIIGDSGDALRSLGTIPEYHDKYAGQVKLVYIDPPFNTKKTFEHYADQLEHSIWLTMMRDRIRDIKPLLTPDGTLWVHLDYAEVHRMRVLLDEEFGEACFVAQVAWRSTDSSSNNAKTFARDHHMILVYSAKPGWRPNFLPDPDKQGHYRNPDNDPRGPWYDGRDVQNPKHRENLRYTITTPSGHTIEPPVNGWRWEWETMQAKMETGEVFFNEEQTAIKRKTYLLEQEGLPPSDLWFNVERTGSSRKAKNHLKKLFPGMPTPSLFDTPKPESLLLRIVDLTTDPGDMILDCFGGSGATAAVAQKTGRRWVTVELIEDTVAQFLLPRLRKVCDGLDPDGVTSTTARVAVADLPEGVSPEDAQKFTTMVGKFTEGQELPIDVISETSKFVRQLAEGGDSSLTADDAKVLLALLEKAREGLEDGATVDVMPHVRKSLRDAAATRDETTVHWVGGGGFTVARMGPSMYEVDDEDGSVYLSAEATNGGWSKAVAGQLKFTLTPDDPVFCGVRKRQRLAVIDGVADETVVRTVVDHLGEKEKAVIVAKGVLPEAAELLQSLSPGSRIKKAPGDMFVNRTVK